MIAVVIPTIRPECMVKFLEAWQPLFDKHRVELVTVLDGEKPTVEHSGSHYITEINKSGLNQRVGIESLMTATKNDKSYKDAIVNFNGGVRNLGFAYVATYLQDADMILTLDDDETPIGDPIQDHLDALNRRVPVSWMSTASEYTRGFPYGIRDEAEVVISHGVWEGVADWDAPTQLVLGSRRPIEFYKGVIPKGIFYPMCSMNLAFKPCMLPYIYHAPWAIDVHRFDDIFAGIISKKALDAKGWAAVTGYARVNHDRASNTFKNLKDEAIGIQLNETFWQGDESHPYFAIYKEKLDLWQEYLTMI